MAGLDIERLKEILKEAKSKDVDDLNNHIDLCESSSLGKTNCELFLIKCTRDSIRERDFLRMIRKLLVQYALRKDEYDEIDEVKAWDIVEKARNRYLKGPQTGEVGEIILFALLESQRDAPQLLNKMSLKTDGNMPVFGLDGVHIGIVDDELRIYFGESKFRKSLNDSIAEAVKDLEAFDRDPKEESFEISLVNNYIDFRQFGDHLEDIVEILNPYAENRSSLREVYAVFIGFDWQSIENLDFSSISEDIQQILESCLRENSEAILRVCSKRVEDSEIENVVEFFLIPFKSVGKSRIEFLEMIK